MTFKINTSSLLDWFDKNKKDYPWSQDKSPYRVWISEIMLQQTVAATVIPYFERWMNRYPDIEQLASSDLQDLLSLWEGLGYYSRCRNISKAANYLKENFQSDLPSDYKELKSVPGIGDYTARAILSIAFKEPFPLVDANVKRILMRLAAIHEWPKKGDVEALKDLEQFLDCDRPGDFNEALMQLGQQICSTGSPQCAICPLSKNCMAYEKGIASRIPEKKVKKIKMSEKTVLLFHSDNKILLRKKKKGIFHDLWMLPTVEEDSFHRMERINNEWTLLDTKLLTKREHFYTDNKDTLSPCLITSDEIDLSHMTPADDETYEHKWVPISDISNYPCPSVYRKILDEVIKTL